MSGYDVKKLVEAGLSHFWSESYGQIYPVLNRLVQDGLATCSVDPKSGGRGRKVYKITKAGRSAFKRWLRQPGDLPRLRDELKLKFFLTSRSDSSESIRLLEEYGEQQRAHLAMLRESEVLLETALRSRDLPDDLLELRDVLGWGETVDAPKRWNELLKFYLTLRSGILVAEVRVAWVAESLLALRGGPFPPRETAKARVSVPKQ